MIEGHCERKERERVWIYRGDRMREGESKIEEKKMTLLSLAKLKRRFFNLH